MEEVPDKMIVVFGYGARRQVNLSVGGVAFFKPQNCFMIGSCDVETYALSDLFVCQVVHGCQYQFLRDVSLHFHCLLPVGRVGMVKKRTAQRRVLEGYIRGKRRKSFS